MVALGLLSLAVALLTPPQRLAQLLPGARHAELSFYQEGRGATVAVVTQGQPERRFHRLYIHGVSNTGDAMPSLRYMRIQALLPLLIHNGEPRSALVIGFGTGITAGALLRYPGLEQRVVAELLPAVLDAAPLFQGNFNAASDPGIQIRLQDGRQELLRSPQNYDLITLEPPPPSAAGVVNLYSRDFYQLAARRLNTQGLVAQWLPLPTQNTEDSRALVQSFLEIFPYATLWTSEFHEMLLVGSPDPIELDAARIERRFAQDSVRSALGEVGVNSAQALLATWVSDRDGLQRFAGDAPAVTDDRPRIEYAPWVRPREINRVLPELLNLRHPPVLVNVSPEFRQRMNQESRNLMQFYRASLHAYEATAKPGPGRSANCSRWMAATPTTAGSSASELKRPSQAVACGLGLFFRKPVGCAVSARHCPGAAVFHGVVPPNELLDPARPAGHRRYPHHQTPLRQAAQADSPG